MTMLVIVPLMIVTFMIMIFMDRGKLLPGVGGGVQFGIRSGFECLS